MRRRIPRLLCQKPRARTSASSAETSMPPPEVVMILFPLRENTPIRPAEPAAMGRPQGLDGILDQVHAMALVQQATHSKNAVLSD